MVVEYKGDNIPPMRSGDRWYRHKWVDSAKNHGWRAWIETLRLVRDPWSGLLVLDFNYRVEFFCEKSNAWIERSENYK